VNAWITSRRIRPGSEDAFRRRWSTVPKPSGVQAAYLLQDEQDPQEILSLSLWQDPEALRRYRDEVDSRNHPDLLADVADEQWNRIYAVQSVPAQPVRGRGLWPLLPVSTLAAAAAAVFVRQRRQRQSTSIVRGIRVYRSKWLFVPALLAPLAAAAYVFFRRMNRADTEFDVPEAWRQPTAGPAPMASATPPPQPSPRTTSAQPTPPAPEQRQRLVREVMTPNPETIEYDADLATAAARMKDLNVGVIPVMADGSLAGIITDRDLALAMTEGSEGLAVRRVRDVMSEVPVTVGPEMTLQAASELMAGHQVRRLPVVDGTQLVGILSLGDLAAQGAEPNVAQALEAISEPASPQR
jgi:CBS domain-containing protein/heme-degrading monooxygenase HmoA